MIVFGLVLVVLSTLRGLFGRKDKIASKDSQTKNRSGKLVKDPICGTYVSDKTISATRGSEIFHFCSDECRQQFLASSS